MPLAVEKGVVRGPDALSSLPRLARPLCGIELLSVELIGPDRFPRLALRRRRRLGPSGDREQGQRGEDTARLAASRREAVHAATLHEQLRHCELSVQLVWKGMAQTALRNVADTAFWIAHYRAEE